MIPIGPSTGWLHAMNMSRDLGEICDFALGAGAEAIGIVIPEAGAEPLTGKVPDGFHFISVHLPCMSLDVDKSELDRLSSIVSASRAQSAVLHPFRAPKNLYQILIDQGIPVVSENMDRNKSVGRSVSDVCRVMRKHQIPGVFDFQHAYEYAFDEGQSYKDVVTEFIDAMMEAGGISHLHVSGENDRTNHALLQHARNREEIMDALSCVHQKIHVPVILEGEFLPDIPEDHVFESEVEVHNE